MLYNFRRRDEPEHKPEPRSVPFPENEGAVTLADHMRAHGAPEVHGHMVYVKTWRRLGDDGFTLVTFPVNQWTFFPYDKRGRAWTIWRFGRRVPEAIGLRDLTTSVRHAKDHPMGLI